MGELCDSRVEEKSKRESPRECFCDRWKIGKEGYGMTGVRETRDKRRKEKRK